MSADHLADNESEELYVEDLNLGDISGAGLSRIFAQPQDAEEPPPRIATEDADEAPALEFSLDQDDDASETKLDEQVSAEGAAGRRRRLLGGLGKLKESFAEELEKARAEAAERDRPKRPKKTHKSPQTEAPESVNAAPAPLEIPSLEERTIQPPLEVPSIPEEPAPLKAPAFYEDEELHYEEPEEPRPAAPSPTPPVEEDPAPLLSGDDEEDRPAQGFMDMLRQRWAMAKASQAESARKAGPEGAGVDLSPPADRSISTIFRRLTGSTDRVHHDASGVVEEEGGFASLLKPLSGSEVALLQAELASDETVFARIDRRRRDMANRQLFGFMIGLACLVFFAASSGRDYLVNVLPNAAQPDWLPGSVKGDPAEAGLFGLGLLFPLISLFVIADGVRYLMSAAVLRRVDDLLIGMVAGACGLGCLYSCSQGQVISGGMFLVAYGIVQLAARLLGVRKG